MNSIIRRKSRLFPLNMKAYLALATKPLLNKKGQIFARIVEDWATIVGDGYAPQLTPQRVVFSGPDAVKGTLYVQAPSHLAPEIPYLTPMLIDKLAQYLSYHHHSD
jgi:hypothetical protein